MIPRTRTNEELVEETAKRAARLALEESNSGASTSKISQIIKQANKTSSQPSEDLEKIEKEKDALKAEKEKTEKEKDALKAEKERLEKENETYKTEKQKLEEIKQKERQDLEKIKENLEKELEENEVFCPTCSSHKHEHKLKKTNDGKMKCTGDGCNTEFALIPTNADYVCKDCGLPHKKPETEIPDDKCPFCSGNEFERPKINFDKLREKVQKKKK